MQSIYNRCMWKAAALLSLFAAVLWADPCEDLKSLAIPHTRILTASATGGVCKVTAASIPSADSAIRIEVWLPVSGWNGKLIGTGNGGFAGKISSGLFAGSVKAGYAVANTDMGMAVDPGHDASDFTGRPERWRDWGWRATHEMTVVEKALVQAFYGQPQQKSYFLGCSTGGEQALMEAERFPEDYDGIASGAPANNRTGVHLSILWNYMATHREDAAYIPPAKLPLLHDAVLAACDAKDGVKDGLLNPWSCQFDPASLQCKEGDAPGCLTARQVETAKEIYRGPVDPKTHKQLYPGVPFGSELDWGSFGPDPARKSSPPYAPIFQWVFGKNWDWRGFDLSRGFAEIQKLLAPDLNATSGDLHRFAQRGGKLLGYHGMADWLVVPGESINYHAAVVKKMKGKTSDFYRLYFIPGMGHCGGGTGPNSLDQLGTLVNWVEKGVAPDKLTATRGGSPLKRAVCPYPQVAKYSGSGDPNDAANYACVMPGKK